VVRALAPDRRTAAGTYSHESQKRPVAGRGAPQFGQMSVLRLGCVANAGVADAALGGTESVSVSAPHDPQSCPVDVRSTPQCGQRSRAVGAGSGGEGSVRGAPHLPQKGPGAGERSPQWAQEISAGGESCSTAIVGCPSRPVAGHSLIAKGEAGLRAASRDPR